MIGNEDCQALFLLKLKDACLHGTHSHAILEKRLRLTQFSGIQHKLMTQSTLNVSIL